MEKPRLTGLWLFLLSWTRAGYCPATKGAAEGLRPEIGAGQRTCRSTGCVVLKSLGLSLAFYKSKLSPLVSVALTDLTTKP